MDDTQLTTVQGRYELRKTSKVVSRGVDGTYYIDINDTPYSVDVTEPSPHRDAAFIQIAAFQNQSLMIYLPCPHGVAPSAAAQSVQRQWSELLAQLDLTDVPKIDVDNVVAYQHNPSKERVGLIVFVVRIHRDNDTPETNALLNTFIAEIVKVRLETTHVDRPASELLVTWRAPDGIYDFRQRQTPFRESLGHINPRAIVLPAPAVYHFTKGLSELKASLGLPSLYVVPINYNPCGFYYVVCTTPVSLDAASTIAKAALRSISAVNGRSQSAITAAMFA